MASSGFLRSDRGYFNTTATQHTEKFQYPTGSFISRDEMHFSGTARLSDQLCANERRKEGDALVEIKTLRYYSRSWCLISGQKLLREVCWPVT